MNNVSPKYESSLNSKDIPAYILNIEAKKICSVITIYILIRSKLIQIRLEYSVLKIKKIKNAIADDIAAPPDLNMGISK